MCIGWTKFSKLLNKRKNYLNAGKLSPWQTTWFHQVSGKCYTKLYLPQMTPLVVWCVADGCLASYMTCVSIAMCQETLQGTCWECHPLFPPSTSEWHQINGCYKPVPLPTCIKYPFIWCHSFVSGDTTCVTFPKGLMQCPHHMALPMAMSSAWHSIYHTSHNQWCHLR